MCESQESPCPKHSLYTNERQREAIDINVWRFVYPNMSVYENMLGMLLATGAR